MKVYIVTIDNKVFEVITPSNIGDEEVGVYDDNDFGMRYIDQRDIKIINILKDNDTERINL